MPTSPELLSTLKKSDDADAKVLAQMAEIGADLSKPHRPEFCFDADTEAQANLVAEDLKRLEYDVEIYLPDKDNDFYQVVASTWMVLDLTAMNDVSKKFEILADQHGVNYDGWGAEIVE